MADTLVSARAVQTRSVHVVLRRRTVVGVNVRKLVGLLVLILVVFFIITRPTDAANTVQDIGNTLAAAGNSIIVFFTTLT